MGAWSVEAMFRQPPETVESHLLMNWTEAIRICSLETFRNAMDILKSLIPFLLASSCATPARDEDSPRMETHESEWIQLFNGKDLDGWRVKVSGYDLDDNSLGIFSVADGVIRIGYENLESFDGEFGHLIFDQPFESYRLRVEYRFLGEQCPGGPAWAWRNSGVMLHGQAPESITKEQSFPVSIEAQMLGGPKDESGGTRSTANLCTPGTHVELDGKLLTQHCVDSKSLTYFGDDWVTIELEVHGGERILHWMDGEVVLAYEAPQLDPGDADAKRLIDAGAELLLSSGYVSLQAESHPMEIRKVEYLPIRF